MEEVNRLREHAEVLFKEAGERPTFQERSCLLLEAAVAMLMAIHDRPRELRATYRKKR